MNGLHRGWGRFGSDFTAFARSLPSLHISPPRTTPAWRCRGAASRTPGDLPGLPGVDPHLLADAAAFHADLRRAAATRATPVPLHAVTGIRQPTPTTAELTGDGLTPLWLIRGTDERGDGAIPRLASRPANADLSWDAVAGLLGQHRPFHRVRASRRTRSR
ncbi:hypothetical protein AB0953_31770 [Streptomyces sp. NPDC046866]|uniref:hypothetical protein n=1 Tax=Streptomyces sp. NPDC046866 TaxID=3154921 RepID=UPI003454265C